MNPELRHRLPRSAASRLAGEENNLSTVRVEVGSDSDWVSSALAVLLKGRLVGHLEGGGIVRAHGAGAFGVGARHVVVAGLGLLAVARDLRATAVGLLLLLLLLLLTTTTIARLLVPTTVRGLLIVALLRVILALLLALLLAVAARALLLLALLLTVTSVLLFA